MTDEALREAAEWVVLAWDNEQTQSLTMPALREALGLPRERPSREEARRRLNAKIGIVGVPSRPADEPAQSVRPLTPFPMQNGPSIPWFLAAAIHEHLYHYSQPLEEIAAGGGFGWDEVAYMFRHPNTTDEQRRLCRVVVRDSLEKVQRTYDEMWEALDAWRGARITDEMVERLAAFLQLEWAGPYSARMRDFMPEERTYRMADPDDAARIRAMQAADREAEAEARRMARKALEKAL